MSNNGEQKNGFRSWLRMLGPGLLMAGAAIGVSHLVQSTRAGADFGWQLLWLVLLINVLKYPFFEFGHRYAIATGRNLLDGYRQLGRFWLGGFLFFNFITAIISIAGVTFVTAALTEYLLGSRLDVTGWSAVLMGVCLLLLLVGHYRWLDLVIKVIMVTLFLATIGAFLMAMGHGPVAEAGFVAPEAFSLASLGFLIALMGWMPAPIELSVWQSLWIQAKERDDGQKMSKRDGFYDFNIGYGMTTLLALVFVALGALVMHGSGEQFSNNGAVFSGQLVDLYGRTIGEWSRPVIGVAAFAAMFSTTLTVIDAYPRSLSVGFKTAFPKIGFSNRTFHALWMIVGCVAGLLIIHSFRGRLRDMIDMATTISFLTAPLFAWLNYLLVTDQHLASSVRPGPVMRIFCWLSMIFLTAFGLLYLLNRFFPEQLEFFAGSV